MIEIFSTADEPVIRQKLVGECYLRGGSVFYRYQETAAEMGWTMTTLKVNQQEIKLMRHGDVESEQIFRVGGRRKGYYETGQSRFNLETETEHILVDLQDGIGRIAWDYHLFLDDYQTDSYHLELTIEAIT